MKNRSSPISLLAIPLVAVAAAAFTAMFAPAALAKSPTVIDLTQVGCQFIESEGGLDLGFMPRSAADCKAINKRTGADRSAKAKPLVLAPGTYVFRVSNKNVPYELGFWLRGKGIARLTLPSVSGGGLVLGKTQDYEITLKPGEYYYSCPLNPTPDYRLVVTG